jgi:two-component system OmpR family sensor kinase
MKSLRRQLLYTLMAALVISSTVVAIVTYQNAKDEIDEMFDANLAQVANTLKEGHAYATNLKATEHRDATHVSNEADFIVQIWGKNNMLEYTSHPYIQFPLQQQKEWSTATFEGETWRVYKDQTGNNTVQVAQLLKERNATIEEVVINIMIPQLVFIPLFGLIIWLAIGKSMKPLVWVSALIAKRGPNALDPIDTKNIPIEIIPLTTALNNLLQRLSEALATQRQFVADAAHELRTPLTALTLQLNMIEIARNDSEREEAVKHYKTGIERSVHLVQQLLILARMEPEAAGKMPATINLAEIVNICVSQFIALAEDKNIDLGIQAIDNKTIEGDFDSLRIMFGNLVDNAIRYTPIGGKIDISLTSIENSILLEIEDSGPGLPPHEYERVFDRFYRAASSGIQGTGLGLSIVKAIAEKHTIQIVLAPASLGGLKVSLIFPAMYH